MNNHIPRQKRSVTEVAGLRRAGKIWEASQRRWPEWEIHRWRRGKSLPGLSRELHEQVWECQEEGEKEEGEHRNMAWSGGGHQSDVVGRQRVWRDVDKRA